MLCPWHNSCGVLHAKMNTSLLQVSLTQFLKQYEHTFHVKCMIGAVKPSGVSCSSPCSTDNALSHVHKHLLPPAPLPCQRPGRGQGFGHRHLMLENKLSSPLCQWPTREAGAASFQSSRVIINNRWNTARPDAVLLTSPSQGAGQQGWLQAAGREADVPNLAQWVGGRAEKSIWVPEYGQFFRAVPFPYASSQWDKSLNGKRDI